MAIACLCAGLIMERYGRKPLFVLMNVLFVIGWMILCFSSSVFGLLLGRFVTGFCVGCLSPAVSVFICEITEPTYRGPILSLQAFTTSLGIFMPHVLGTFLRWDIVAGICALIPFTAYAMFALVPESPAWLLDNGQIEKAYQSFTWFRGHAIESMEEFEKLVEGQKLSKKQSNPMEWNNVTAMIQTKSFYIPFGILLLYFATLQSAGPNAIIFYTVQILKDSLGEGINEYKATIIVDLTRLAASILGCIVVKHFGRRPLTTFSGVATAGTLFTLAAYLLGESHNEQLKSFYGIPLTLFALYVMAVTVGLNPLVWILTGELFPLRYRAVGSGLVSFFNFVFMFLSVKSTPAMFRLFGDEGVFCIFGICCLVGTVLLTVYLPETRNKTLQEIEDSYNNPPNECCDEKKVKDAKASSPV